MERLAIDGGKLIFERPLPARKLIGEEEKLAVMRLFDDAIKSGEAFGYNGPAEKQYEKDFVDFMQGGFADGVNSGTNAVFCALGALQLEPFSEIVVPPITDPGGVMPVVMLGCVPVMADSDPRSYNVCAETIEAVITERTKAIVVAHIAGEPADIEPIIKLAKKYNLYVVEDCAQSHGAEYKGRKVGSFGDIAAFSTMFGKHHCTGGQGGVVYTQNEKLHWQGRRFADRGKPFGLDGIESNVTAGLNCNLNELSATIGTVQLKKLPKIIEKRRAIGEQIKEGLQNSKAISMGWQVPDTRCVYWFLRFKILQSNLSVTKDEFCKALIAEGIGEVLPSYRHIPCEGKWFKDRSVFGKSGFPWSCSEYKGNKEPVFKVDNALKVLEEHFNLLINESYGQQEIEGIIAAINKVERAFLR
ncbi:MAG: hypothetical protein A2Y10_04310 [Planctomycetes bacterium GWF2_41_51]|nr:MAG: hypothetical protein A2Y10_04310 [Planctomycetes bacterium GWF2_41_51]HBG27809.1 hypothetical protein [Phycisphaerales bacterium]